ncbi:MAG: PLP-dependent aminotransferase family protein [Thermodesulfobacteriota bacterium]
MRTEQLLARRTRNMNVNFLREILKTASQPGMMSLAGGVPAPESFPLEMIIELSASVLRKYGAGALQYGPSEGFGPLREALSRHLEQNSIPAAPDDILISSGSQGALDAVAKILVSRGDRVAIESPTYLGALHAFNPYEPEYVRLEADEHGPTPEGLRRILKQGKIKFIYLVPTFQNPTGKTIPLHRRQEIAEVIKTGNALLIEDDPYSALRYEGDPIPAIRTMAPDQVIYLGTLSKVLAPGLRVGFCLAPNWVKRWLVIAKQGIDLHTGSLSQALAAEYLSGGHLERHLPKIIALYAPRRQAMLESLEACFPKNYSWSRPDGGMFVWVMGPKEMDMEPVYAEALKRGVAFVPGRFFHIDGGEGRETMRLNFTMFGEREIRRAVKTIADILAG